ncbi:MAG: GNAT family N-acetyltransferase [Bacteroidales bacterium]|nr:GNAT family N-acetyltransferase [Bacteroidales bacterium]
MTNKEKYIELCKTEGSRIPLFLQYWWLDIVSEGRPWNVVLAEDLKGRIAGAWPYVESRRLGMKYVLQSRLTQYTGPWISPRIVGSRSEVLSELASQLRKEGFAYFQQCAIPESLSEEAILELGMAATQRVTYRLDDISDPEAVFANFDPKGRKAKIRRCTKATHLVEMTPDAFADMHERYWKYKGQKDITPRLLMIRLMQESIDRGCGRIMALANEQGQIVGAHFVVYDSELAYFLLSTHNYYAEVKGSMETLVWESIKWLSDKTRAYDFEGSMEPGQAYFNRSFGSRRVTYYMLEQHNSRLFDLLLKLKR